MADQNSAPPEATEVAGVGRALAEADEPDWPVHGLRHPPENGTSGWYIWTGELGDNSDFFVPLHPRHLAARCPDLLPLLHSPPGTRFLIAPDHEDVWHDPSLLELSD